jgi:hypothetical protein
VVFADFLVVLAAAVSTAVITVGIKKSGDGSN